MSKTHLQFDHPVMLVGGGELDLSLVEHYRQYTDVIIAADGGANILFDNKISPHAVIGDMDSIDQTRSVIDDCAMIHLEEQDTTDFEKCLYSVRAPLFIALGFTGKRLDHTLSSLHVLSKYHGQKNIVLVDPHTINFIHKGQFETELRKGDLFSVAPVDRIHFSHSEGLQYPLDGIVLEMGRMVGTSNTATGGRLTITPADNSVDAAYLISLPSCRFAQAFL